VVTIVNPDRFLAEVCRVVRDRWVWKENPHRHQHLAEAVRDWLTKAGVQLTVSWEFLSGYCRTWLRQTEAMEQRTKLEV
jgi:hypothetical protein